MGNRAVIVPASAGSGKTYRIAHEYIYDTLRNHTDSEGNQYFDPLYYKRILAVTFTNKATEEMKSRIVKDLHKIASGQKSDHLEDLIQETELDEKELRRRAKIVCSAILHDYSHFTILTNDTFFQRILRAFIRELGIDINFSTELDPAPIILRAIDEIIDDTKGDETLRSWITALFTEKVEEGSKWDIARHIQSLTHELGKERIQESVNNIHDKRSFTERINRITENPELLNDKLKELAQRALQSIDEAGYQRNILPASIIDTLTKIAECGHQTIRSNSIFKKSIDDNYDIRAWFSKSNQNNSELLEFARTKIQPLIREIYYINCNQALADKSRELILKHYRSFALLYDIQKKVEELCQADNSMILNQTKHTIADLISEEDAPFIYEKVGNYYSKFMIDEFQDTSFKEWNNFLPLLRNAMAQSEDTSALIVGDVKQSIYRWRGGDWRILGEQVEKDLGRDVVKSPLEYNWRSLQNIVEFNNELFTKVIEVANAMLNKRLDEALKGGLISEELHIRLYDTLSRAYKEHGQKAAKADKREKGYVEICFTESKSKSGDKSSEATQEATQEAESADKATPPYIECIKQLLCQGYKPSDITLLVRTNKESAELAEELLAAREEFPEEHRFEITTEVALKISSSPATRLIIAILRLAIDRESTSSLTLYNHLVKGGQYAATLTAEENHFLDSIRSMSPEEAFERITVRYAEVLKGHTAYVQALHEQIVRFCANKCADISTFDKWWREKSDNLSLRVERNERAIEIMTIHKAKGLDNKIIIIPKCSWKLGPRSASGNSSGIIWTKLQHSSGINDDMIYPISYSKSAVDSHFAEDVFNEIVSHFVESINLLYVATTRAAEQLYIYVDSPAEDNISKLVAEAYLGRANKCEDGALRYKRGTPEPCSQDEKPKATPIMLGEYTASNVNLQLRTNHSRYFTEGEGKPTQRSKGIKLHRAFERAATREDIFNAIDKMVISGDISAAEANELKLKITNSLDNTIAGEWFDGSWEHIHNERNILEAGKATRRPDRVMTRGEEAIIIDYKFGYENASYKSKVASYKELLGKMGYKRVKGYLWYITLDKIEEV